MIGYLARFDRVSRFTFTTTTTAVALYNMRSFLSTLAILLYATASLAQIEKITVNSTDPSIVAS
jgi:hypothetical protein